jgi:signal transduction histidine kinase
VQIDEHPFSPQAARAEAVEELCDGFAHDSRNPLHAMVIHLEVLSDKLKRDHGEVPIHLQKNLKSMRDQVDRIDELIRQFVQIASPKRQSTPEFDGSALVKSVIGLCTHRARIQRADIRADLQDGIQIAANASDMAAPLTLALRDLLESGVQRIRVALWGDSGTVNLELEGGPLAPGSTAVEGLEQLAKTLGGHFEPSATGLRMRWPSAAASRDLRATPASANPQEQLG